MTERMNVLRGSSSTRLSLLRVFILRVSGDGPTGFALTLGFLASCSLLRSSLEKRLGNEAIATVREEAEGAQRRAREHDARKLEAEARRFEAEERASDAEARKPQPARLLRTGSTQTAKIGRFRFKILFELKGC